MEDLLLLEVIWTLSELVYLDSSDLEVWSLSAVSF